MSILGHDGWCVEGQFSLILALALAIKWSVVPVLRSSHLTFVQTQTSRLENSDILFYQSIFISGDYQFQCSRLLWVTPS
eukprot:m.256351 g.256351  ORF g.256351 m.256351 type:complete len:79 (-) comp15952_c0_seq1:232-468(-)